MLATRRMIDTIDAIGPLFGVRLTKNRRIDVDQHKNQRSRREDALKGGDDSL